MVLNPIPTTTMQEKAYDALLTAILSGQLPPGEKITMEGLAAMLNISLTPVRAALKKLEAGNFVTIGNNRRISVTKLSRENLSQILRIRILLESYAAELACKYAPAASVRRLGALNDACDAAKTGDEYLQQNYLFHNALYAEAKMPMLSNLIDNLWQQVSPYLHILMRRHGDVIVAEAEPFHLRMIEAVRTRDSAAIKCALTDDLTHAAELILAEFGDKE